MLKQYWLVLLVICSIIFFTLSGRSTFINDTYYHLSIGRQVLNEKEAPSTDKFIYSIENPKYTSTEWLAGTIFYLSYVLLKTPGLLALEALVVMIILVFFFKSINLLTKERNLSCLVTFIVGYMLSFRINLRPEIFSLAFLSFINYQLIKYYLKKDFDIAIYFFPFIFLAWPNVHGFSALGLAVMMFFLILISIEKFISKKEIRPYYRFVLIFLLCLLSLLVQHERTLILMHANRLGNIITEMLSLRQRIFPPKHMQGLVSQPTIDIFIYLTVLPAIMVITVLSLKKITFSKVLIAAFCMGTILLPIRFYRLIQPSLLIVVPWIFILSKSDNLRPTVKISNYFKYLTVFLSIILILFTLIQFRLDENFGLDTYYPQAATSFISGNLESKRIFTSGLWNDYFIWKIPEIKTFSDVITEYRNNENLETDKRIHNPAFDPKEEIERFKIDTVVNTVSTSPGSFTAIHKLDGWKLVYVDDMAIVWAKDDIIKDKSIIIKHIKPYLNQELKFTDDEKEKALDELDVLNKKQPDNIFPKSQLIIYNLKLYIETNNKDYLDKAISMSFEGKKYHSDKNNGVFSYYLAFAYSLANDCPKSRAFAQEAVDKDPTNQTLRDFLKLSKDCGDPNIKFSIK